MKVIYMWINDFLDNKKEIEAQLFYENQQEKIFKLVLCYEESYVWEMVGKTDNTKINWWA